jgi:hypothetical protein
MGRPKRIVGAEGRPMGLPLRICGGLPRSSRGREGFGEKTNGRPNERKTHGRNRTGRGYQRGRGETHGTIREHHAR